jgi:heat shock protein HslJ
MGIRLAVVLVAPLLVLAACGDSGTADVAARSVPDLDATSWIVTSITENGSLRAVVPDSEIRVSFADGAISIEGGCNHLSGRYALSSDAQLTTESFAGTMMACAQPLMDQDTWLTGTAFAKPLLASVSGQALTLSRDGLEIVLGDRATLSPDVLLEGTAWQLDGIRSGESVSSLPAGLRVPTFTLASDGTVTIDTGCNSGRGTAHVSGSTITFGPIATTKRACADKAGRQIEAAVLAILSGEADWSITEKTLTITSGDRGLVYRAAS